MNNENINIRQIQKDNVYMQMAENFAKLSYAKRKQVGCLIVDQKDNIISTGFNGTPKGMDNACEDEDGKTLWYVLHSESNAITKLSKSTISSEGSTMYVTLSPCQQCAKLILQAGIRRIVFLKKHSCTSGIDFLISNGVECELLTQFVSDSKPTVPNKEDKFKLLDDFEHKILFDHNLPNLYCVDTLNYIGNKFLKDNLNKISGRYSSKCYEIILRHLKYYDIEIYNKTDQKTFRSTGTVH